MKKSEAGCKRLEDIPVKENTYPLAIPRNPVVAVWHSSLAFIPRAGKHLRLGRYIVPTALLCQLQKGDRTQCSQ
jgi:hypothetical protein